MKDTTRIVIAEHEPIVRDGMRGLLSLESDFQVVGTAADGGEAIKTVEDLRPDVVLMDLSMPKMRGSQTIREMRERTPETKILVLTIHKEEESMLAALEAGVSGYCVKDVAPEELVRAVRTIMDGKAYLSSAVARTIMTGYVKGTRRTMCRSSWDSLTSRDKDVLKLIAESHSNKEIGDMLSISVRTVVEIRQGLMSKLGLHSSAALTDFAIERGLISR